MRRINQTTDVLEIREYFETHWLGILLLSFFILLTLIANENRSLIPWIFIAVMFYDIFVLLKNSPFSLIRFDYASKALTIRRYFLWRLHKEEYELGLVQGLEVVHKDTHWGRDYFLQIKIQGQLPSLLVLSSLPAPDEYQKLIATISTFLAHQLR